MYLTNGMPASCGTPAWSPGRPQEPSRGRAREVPSKLYGSMPLPFGEPSVHRRGSPKGGLATDTGAPLALSTAVESEQ